MGGRYVKERILFQVFETGKRNDRTSSRQIFLQFLLLKGCNKVESGLIFYKVLALVSSSTSNKKLPESEFPS